MSNNMINDFNNSIRFDSLKLPKMRRTKEGFLRGKAVVSRTGVFKYRNVDGSIRGELRHPDNIFKLDSLETLKMIPITNDHPPEFVDASNAHKYQVGYTGEHYDIDNDKVIVSMTITHQDAIDAILAGKLELSLGYTVNLKPEQGQYEGENYDAVQLDPNYNHLALVLRGRAGSIARLRFDGAYELVESKHEEAFKQDVFINNTKEFEMTKENTDRIDTLMSENKQLELRVKNLQLKLDTAESELAKEKALKTDAIIEAKVMDRAELIAKATPFLGQIENLFKKTDREIMEGVINHGRTDNAIDLKERSDDYIKGVFETTVNIVPRQHMDAKGEIAETMKRLRNFDGADSAMTISKLPSNIITERFREIIFNSRESK